jgi:replicative superfamily II helicase
VIVFRNQRGTAQGCARYLADELGLKSADDALALLPEMDLSSTSADLRECLSRGTAFHSTNLSRDEKQVVERAFRDPNGPVRVLGATTTVAAGINTPASTVIIAEQEFLGEDGREFTIAEYKNMAGRAGRLGFNEKGKAIILANDIYEANSLFSKYVKGTPEAVASSFQPAELNTWIIRLLAQVKKAPQKDVGRLLADTYGGFLASRQYPGWRQETERTVQETLSRMLQLGLVEQEGEDVRLTLLGRACGQSSLVLSSAMRLVELLRAAGSKLVPEHLLAIVQALPESDGGYTPLFKKGQKEAVRPSQAAQHFGYDVVELLQRYCEDTHDYWARCKRAAILADWISGMPVNEIENNYTATPFQGRIGYGDIRKFADNTRFHLRAAYQIAAVLFADYGAHGEVIDVLIKRLEQGLPADALPLLELPILMERGDYLALYETGARTAADVWKISDGELVKVLGNQKASKLKTKRSS